MRLPTLGCLVAIGCHRSQPAPRRVDSRVQRPPPRVRDRCTHSANPALAHELLPLLPQFAGTEGGRCTRVDGQPWVTGHFARPPGYSHILTVNPNGEWKHSILHVSWRATHRPLSVPSRGVR